MMVPGPFSVTIHVSCHMLSGTPQEDHGLKRESPHNLPAGLLLVKELRLRHPAEEAMLFTMECISG